MREHTPDESPASQDDAALVQLLRAAGKREAPPADFAQELKAALKAEWLEQVAQRARSRRRWSMAGAAVAAMVLMGIGVGFWRAMGDQVVAQVVVAEGAASQAPGVQALIGQEVRIGNRLTTGANSHMAIALGTALSLRLDENTEVLVDGREHLTVVRGAVYVDAGQDPGARQPLTLLTTYGNVRHLGTQYEVRLLNAEQGVQLSIRVREGTIRLERQDEFLQGAAGEQLLVSENGNVERLPLAADAPAWNWIAGVTPPFEIDNRPLAEFLVWAGRETGREVVFSSPAAQAQASQVVLRGSVAGLTPDQAVDAVLATTALKVERVPGQLRIRD